VRGRPPECAVIDLGVQAFWRNTKAFQP